MLMVMPFMLLIGIHPTTGRNKMKNYFLTVLALMLQSVVLASLLAVMFRIMIGFGQASDNIAIATIASGIVALIFFGIRKDVLGLVFSDVKRATGERAMFNADGHTDGTVPGYLANKLQRAGRGANALAGGMIGGYAAGGVSGMEPSVGRAFNAQMAYVKRMQRYKGKGAVQTFTEGFSNASKEAKKDLNDDIFVQGMRDDALLNSKEYKEYEKKKKEYDDFDGEERKTYDGVGKVAVNGNFILKPQEPKSFDSTQLSSRQSRKVSKTSKKIKNNIALNQKNIEKQGINISPSGQMSKDIKDSNIFEKREREFRGRTEQEYENKRTRPLTQEEMIQYNKTVEDANNKQENLEQKGQKRYEHNQNVEYTKKEMKDALREARETLGEKNAKRRFF